MDPQIPTTYPNPVPETVLTSKQVEVVEDKPKSSPILPVILVLLLLLSLGSTAFLYYQNTQLKNMLASYQTIVSPAPSATTDSAANWKTYAAKKFSFKYPIDWQVGLFQSTPDMLTLQPSTNFVAESQKNSVVFAVTNHCLNTQCLTVLNLDEMAKEWNVIKISKTTIDGAKAYKVSFPDKKIGYMFINGDDFFIISTDKYQVELDQILSTFKFLGQTASTPASPVACTEEAKLCPDGSYVGRTGPNCEFSACP